MASFDPLTAVHYQPTDPGTSWIKDPGIVIDTPEPLPHWKALTPNVIALPAGGFRMYYTLSGPGTDYRRTPASILSARSDDGSHWTPELDARVGPHAPSAEKHVVCPDVIPLADGGYRMYFEGWRHDGPSAILSARSDDGLAWTPEPGIRVGDGRWSYGSPRGIYIEDGIRLYCHRYTYPLQLGLDAGNHIISARSTDGLTFEPEPGVRIEQSTDLETFSVYAPEVLRLGDGSFRMYYAGWTSEPVHGRIFSATSPDGLSWTKDPEPNVDIGGRWDSEKCSEPCVMRLPDGRYRMFYEASDSTSTWRILSCTAKG
jgi:hypothetical protein